MVSLITRSVSMDPKDSVIMRLTCTVIYSGGKLFYCFSLNSLKQLEVYQNCVKIQDT